MKKTFFLSCVFFIFTVGLFCGLPFELVRFVFAASVSWDGGAATNNWCDAANWSGDALPTDVDDVTIDTAVTVSTDSCADGAVDFNSLTIGGTAAATLDVYAGDFGTVGDITIRHLGILEQNTNLEIAISGDLIIENGGTLTHADNATTHLYSVYFNATNITIEPGGSINVDGLGYNGGIYPSNGSGPAGGFGKYGGNSSSGGGGAHCGNGGNGTGVPIKGGVGYGSITEVTTIGAGGGPGHTGGKYGGAGGGLIRLISSGNISVEGVVSADGNTGDPTGNYGNGGGAGGGIYLSADVIEGEPQSFTATGGIGTVRNGRPAGGGRGRLY